MKNIDQAINEFKGVWPDWATMAGEPICWCDTTKQWFQLSTPLMQERQDKPTGAVCTRVQFSSRIRYLVNRA